MNSWYWQKSKWRHRRCLVSYFAEVLPQTGQVAGPSCVTETSTAINAIDEIVGTIVTSSGYFTSFVYVNGQSYDLNTFVPAGWGIGEAVGINDSGEIVGTGGYADYSNVYSDGGILMKPM